MCPLSYLRWHYTVCVYSAYKACAVQQFEDYRRSIYPPERYIAQDLVTIPMQQPSHSRES